MEKSNLLLQRLDEIGKSLEKSKNGLAILALGSCGIERDRLDQYSDLDFFAIVRDGYKERYIGNLDWLEDVAPIGYRFRNTQDGYKLLYEDGVFCEFAVFEKWELKNIPYSEGSVVWRDEHFDEAVSFATGTVKPESKEIDVDYLVGEALTNLYVGMGRFRRGEKYSALRFVQTYAVDRITELMIYENQQNLKQSSMADRFDLSRRMEKSYPGTGPVLAQFMQGYERTPQSAGAILNFLSTHYKVNNCIKNEITRLILQKD